MTVSRGIRLVVVLPLITLIAAATPGCANRKTPGKPGSSETKSKASSRNDLSKTSRGTIRFSDVTAQTGINFTPRNGEQTGHFSILESLGTGVGLLDFDADGRLDMFLPGGGGFGPGPRVVGRAGACYRNKGGLEFDNVSRETGLNAVLDYSHGCYVADYDNDGFSDVLVTGYGGIELYHNRGDGTFENVTEKSGFKDRQWSTGAAWGDFNEDGHLDVFVTHYVDWSFKKHPICEGFGGARDVCSPNDFDALDDGLYVSNGDGTFRVATKEAGLVSGGKGLGVIAGDLNGDGKIDLYVANDTTPNFLYSNKGNGRFDETGLFSAASLNPKTSADGSMGLELADLNLDGRPDIFVTNFEHQSFALYRNEGGNSFQHVSARMGFSAIGNVYVGFGTVAADFDNDGDEDLVVSNGHVMMHSRNSPLKQQPLLLENLAGRSFLSASKTAGAYFQKQHRGRGVACGDLDSDGRDDIVITHINAPVSVLRNDSPTTQPKVRIRLVGTATSRTPIGATVALVDSKPKQVRFVKSGASYLSTSDSTLSFRVKDSDRPIVVVLNWPGGKTEKRTLPSSGEYVIIQNGALLRIR